MNDTYLHHNMPAVMELSLYKWSDFLDLVTMANDQQLEAMERHIRKAKQERDGR